MSNKSELKTPQKLLDATMRLCSKAVVYAFFFSLLMNLLSLAMPLYSLQVLDRVLSTGSYHTLAVLSVIVIICFLCLSVLQAARSHIFLSISNYLELKLSPSLFRHVISSAATNTTAPGNQSLRDLNLIRDYITHKGLKNVFDIIWAPIYLLVLYLIHPVMALIAIFGITGLVLLALLNEKVTAESRHLANDYEVSNIKEVEGATRNSEIIEAMGMSTNIIERWEKINHQALEYKNAASNFSIMIASSTQFFRYVAQMLMMGVGAYLVLNGTMSAGGIIAAAIISGKTLAPFDMAITTVQNTKNVIAAYKRIEHVLKTMITRKQNYNLPTPRGNVSIEKVYFYQKGSSEAVLKGLNFEVPEGKVIGIIGSTGSGKSVLAKLLAGIWKPSVGVIRLDSIDIFDWGRDYVKNYIGYLPQKTIFFNGTIRENIAKMDQNASDELLYEATKITGIHRDILRLPHGYETKIGKGGHILSEGILQCISLARAFYGRPKMIVFDEPHSNLDVSGELSLLNALQEAKNKNTTMFVISDRPSLLSTTDSIIVMNDGTITDYGKRDEMMEKYIFIPTQTAKPVEKKTTRRKKAS